MIKLICKNYASKAKEIVYTRHYPVMWKNIMRQIDDYIYKNDVESSNLKEPKVFGDFTIGCGGHSKLILENFQNSHVVGLDVDEKMIAICEKELNDHIEEERLVLVEDSYVTVEELKISDLFERKFNSKKKFDYILVDLGYNSVQLEDKERGLSYMLLDSPLDMRYDMHNDTKGKASDVLNNLSEYELGEIFKKFGDEKYYEHIAKNVIKFRVDKKFKTVRDFVSVIDETFSNKAIDKFNTYARLFQALRIVCNYEILNIQRFLSSVFFNLEINGILSIITFHSLEETIVRRHFKNLEKAKLVKVIDHTKPSQKELEENSRSRSATLHTIQFNPK